MLNLYFS